MIYHTQKNVTVDMERNEEIVKIVFDIEYFQIFWKDGTVTYYKYEFDHSKKSIVVKDGEN